MSDEDIVFKHVYNLEHYHPTLLESLVLRFVKERAYIVEDMELYYKPVGSSMYITRIVYKSRIFPEGYDTYRSN